MLAVARKRIESTLENRQHSIPISPLLRIVAQHKHFLISLHVSVPVYRIFNITNPQSSISRRSMVPPLERKRRRRDSINDDTWPTSPTKMAHTRADESAALKFPANVSRTGSTSASSLTSPNTVYEPKSRHDVDTTPSTPGSNVTMFSEDDPPGKGKTYYSNQRRVSRDIERVLSQRLGDEILKDIMDECRRKEENRDGGEAMEEDVQGEEDQEMFEKDEEFDDSFATDEGVMGDTSSMGEDTDGIGGQKTPENLEAAVDRRDWAVDQMEMDDGREDGMASRDLNCNMKPEYPERR